jgi:hypothetical protein
LRETKLEVIKAEVERLIASRLGILHREASDLSADMEALIGRLQNKGGAAKVDDLKAGRWYRTASDLRLLQEIYTFVCRVGELQESKIEMEVVDDASGPVEIEDEVTESHKIR